jgi:ATP-dependent DNA helicase RecG
VDDLACLLSAFSNSSSGGVLLMGVGDKDGAHGGDVEGLPVFDNDGGMKACEAVQRRISKALEKTFPKKRCKAATFACELFGKLLLFVDIPPSSEPIAVQIKKKNSYYSRVGESAMLADEESAAGLKIAIAEETGMFAVDRSVPRNGTLGVLDTELLVSALRFQISFDMSLFDQLQGIGLVSDQRGVVQPTLASILLFANPEHPLGRISDELHFAYIQCVDFISTRVDNNKVAAQHDCNGNIRSQLDQALSFVEKNARQSSKIVGAVRQDHLCYPLETLRELLANALIHRDYSKTGEQIKLHMFLDRLELHVPGRLMPAITLENIHTKTAQRNSVLAIFAAALRLCESRGAGVSKIKTDIPSVNYDLRGDGVHITVPAETGFS